jgi:hypothetical protein
MVGRTDPKQASIAGGSFGDFGWSRTASQPVADLIRTASPTRWTHDLGDHPVVAVGI